MKRAIFYIFIIFMLNACSYYSDNNKNITMQKREQESRTALLSADNKLKVVARLTHLNELNDTFYKNKEYFFLELYSTDNKDLYTPQYMKFTLFKKKPVWIRYIDKDEFDNFLYTQNIWSSGYLIAFDKVEPNDEKNIKVTFDLFGFKSVIFDFSYIILRSTI